MISKIIFNGRSSEDFGILVEQLPNSVHASRRGDTYTVPGRSGSLVHEENAYENYTLAYAIWFRDPFNHRNVYQIARDLAAWLLTSSGYCRFEDSYEPDVYRLARYAGPLDVETPLRTAGKAVLEFDFQPRRYIKTGNQEIALTSGVTTINNPTAFEAQPLIQVKTLAQASEVIPIEYELTWEQDYEILSKHNSSSNAHKVMPYSYTTSPSYVSDPIDVSAIETAIVTCAVRTDPVGGAYLNTCYTFTDASGNPVGNIRDVGYMDHVELAVPKKAKYLRIAGMKHRGSGSQYEWYIEPSVTLIPKPVATSRNSITINGQTVFLRFMERSVITLDCELHDSRYEDGSNANGDVAFGEEGNPFATYPVLQPGENTIVVEDISTLEAVINPRWWTL